MAYHVPTVVPLFGDVPIALARSFESVQIAPQADFEIYLEELNATSGFQVSDIVWHVSSPEVVLKLSLEGHLRARAVLIGELEKGDPEPTFRLKGFSLSLETKAETPIAVFLSSSLGSVLGLGFNPASNPSFCIHSA